MSVRRIAALGAAVISSVLLLAPAQAQAAGTCPSTYYCVFENADYNGGRCAWSGTIANYVGWVSDTGSSCNDTTTSWMVRGTGGYSCILGYKHADYSLKIWQSALGGTDQTPGVPSYYNDVATSHLWVLC